MKKCNLKNNDYLSPCGRESQSGRSMIEMLGVLAIIGVLSVGGIAGYSKAMMKYRINKTIEQITLIAGNIRTFFAPQGNYAGLDNEKVIRKAKLIPEEMIEYYVEGPGISIDYEGTIKSIINPFDGAFIIHTEEDYRAFGFSLTNIPEEACIELLSNDWTELNVTHFCHSGPPVCITPKADFDKILTLCEKAKDSYLFLFFELKNELPGDGSWL
ncbi:MAG: hypothetical protein IJ525_07830 [Alphaproteobacteria bacterium]|nr:hypothetical protein [Alphaproteobacteria bacterium]